MGSLKLYIECWKPRRKPYECSLYFKTCKALQCLEYMPVFTDFCTPAGKQRHLGESEAEGADLGGPAGLLMFQKLGRILDHIWNLGQNISHFFYFLLAGSIFQSIYQ